MPKPKACVLRTAGTNCDKETAFAFVKAGAEACLVHINRFIDQEERFSDYQILAIPGGFTYGDDIAAGKILANELKYRFAQDLREFIARGKLVIGICNGFQVLVKAGILPGNSEFNQEANLIINDSGKFEDRWVYLQTTNDQQPAAKCVWAKNLPEVIYLPVAHGEGKFITKDRIVLERLKKNGQVVFQYCNESGESGGYPFNPNGSVDDIAGICDETGRILGLMPHPERHVEFYQHPRWTQTKKKSVGVGFAIFKNGVNYIKRFL